MSLDTVVLLQEWRLSHHEETVRKILDIPGVSGLHVMPLTKRARQDAALLISSGVIGGTSVARP